MKKPITKRGRKKLFSNIPSNYDFWCGVLKNPNETHQFLTRGDENQKNSIVRTLNYMRKFNRELFDEVKGSVILNTLKEFGQEGNEENVNSC